MTQPLPTQISASNAPDNNVRIGTVTRAAPLIVNVQGGDVENPGVLFGANLEVGSTVALLRQDQSWLVLGPVATSGLTTITGPAAFAGNVTNFTTTSTSYANYFPAGNKPWVKRFDHSLVRIDATFSGFVTATATEIGWGIQLLGSALIPVGPSQFFNVANSHQFCSNNLIVPGIPAGAYTARPIMSRISGAGTATTDANDWLSYIVQEVF